MIRITHCLLLVPLALAWPCTAAEPQLFHGDKDSYSIIFPSHWVRIPNNVLDGVQKAIFKSGSKPCLRYEAGYQEGGSFGWMKYPYVLVQSIPYAQYGASGEPPECEFPKLVETISGMKLDKVMNDAMTPAARGILKDTPKLTARLDAPNRRYFFSMAMQVATVGTVRGEAVGYFGRDGVVQIMFYAIPKDLVRTANVRDRIFDSFKFDAAHAYDPAAAVASPVGPVTKRVLDHAMIGGIVGGSIAVLVCLMRAFRRDQSQY